MTDPSTILKAGTPAPDFTLPVTPDQTVSLSDFRGKPLILAFYPNDFSPVCGDQLGLYNEILSEFHKHHAELLGISVDSSWCHGAFASNRRLHFPLLADFEPKGAVAKRYGVYREHEGTAKRPRRSRPLLVTGPCLHLCPCAFPEVLIGHFLQPKS